MTALGIPLPSRHTLRYPRPKYFFNWELSDANSGPLGAGRVGHCLVRHRKGGVPHSFSSHSPVNNGAAIPRNATVQVEHQSSR